MSAKLVPFGRYRGQPLDQMLNDQSYVEWLVKQDWFVQRFPDIHSITMNWGNPDMAQTPEHNAMQARFLDKGYAKAMVRLHRPPLARVQDILIEMLRNGDTLCLKDPNASRSGRRWSTYPQDGGMKISPGQTIAHGQESTGWDGSQNIYKDVLHTFVYGPDFGDLKVKRDFEVGGWDVKLRVWLDYTVLGRHWRADKAEPEKYVWEWVDLDPHVEQNVLLDRTIYLELKPHVSDDYPAILRQMKKNRDRVTEGTDFVLVAGSIKSQVVSAGQIKAFFAAADFGVLDLSEHPELDQIGASVEP